MTTDTDSIAPPVKHTAPTPGPWKVWTAESDASVNIVNAQGEYVCLVGREKAGDADVDQIRADAELICAAPSLLEALNTTAANIRSLGPAGAIPEPYTVWLRVVEAAIQKADGRSAVRS